MENILPKPTIKFSTLIVVAVLGALIGVGIYKLGAEGKLSLPNFSSNKPTAKPTVEPKNLTILNEENAVISVVEKSSPSVVAIGATQRIFNPFNPFAAPQNQSSTIGTGFVVSNKGIIVTNKHVVSESSTTYNVVTNDGTKLAVRKIYRDPILDLAIVQVDGGNLKALEMGDSSKIKVGQTVIAIGNALGKFTNTVTTGVVSGLGRKVVAGDPFYGSWENLDDLIQTDAAINPGNSGGPLLNSAGQVIGVNVATTDGAQNISFAIPINAVNKIADEFIQKGSVSRPFLGVNYIFITKERAITAGVPQGAYVNNIVPNSSADQAGITTGDIITKIDGKAVNSQTIISDTITSKSIGDRLNLTIWNNDKERDIVATLQELPNQ